MRFARFEDNYGRETYVNADRVNFVQQYDNALTSINFGDKEEIFVKMAVSAVASGIANAGKV